MKSTKTVKAFFNNSPAQEGHFLFELIKISEKGNHSLTYPIYQNLSKP